MKKTNPMVKAALLTTAVAMVGTLAACGASTDTKTTPSPASSTPSPAAAGTKKKLHCVYFPTCRIANPDKDLPSRWLLTAISKTIPISRLMWKH